MSELSYAEKLIRFVENSSPLTDEEKEKATQAVQYRLTKIFGHSVPVLWAGGSYRLFRKLLRVALSCCKKPSSRPADAAKREKLDRVVRSLCALEVAERQGTSGMLWSAVQVLLNHEQPLFDLTDILPEPHGRDVRWLLRAVQENFPYVDDIWYAFGNKAHYRAHIEAGINFERFEHPPLDAAFMLVLFPRCVVALERPVRIRLLGKHMPCLHCKDGPAFVAANGVRECYILGRSVPSCFEKPPEELKDEEVLALLAYPEVDVRTIILERIGIERALKACGAIEIDSQSGYILYKPSWGLKACCLEMQNPTTGAQHLEWVPGNCKTVKEALEFRNRVPGLPSVLT